MKNCIERDIAEFKEIAINGVERAYKVGYEQGYCDGEKKEHEKRMDNNIDAIDQLNESGWMERHDREVYLDGYEEGKKVTIKESEQITNQDIADAYKQGYEKGLDDNAFSEEDCIDLLQSTGWMKKHDKEIYLNGMDDLKKALSDKAYLKANFNTGNWLNIIRDFPADKIVKEWKDFRKESNTEIKVGDVVTVPLNDREEKAIVTHITKGSSYPYSVMFDDGETMDCVTVTPLNRHIDIDFIFEQINGVINAEGK